MPLLLYVAATEWGTGKKYSRRADFQIRAAFVKFVVGKPQTLETKKFNETVQNRKKFLLKHFGVKESRASWRDSDVIWSDAGLIGVQTAGKWP